ncbi:unnamed protein product [Gongylonema pulchrum]|uniref:Glutaredoxin domain-containing protein n=1 Tax=Gongylonema pulchrum TaxID=637853 RepID=A0A183E238_9BILA|nr:unnamed protein product [Gongylonema pulchrum]
MSDSDALRAAVLALQRKDVQMKSEEPSSSELYIGNSALDALEAQQESKQTTDCDVSKIKVEFDAPARPSLQYDGAPANHSTPPHDSTMNQYENGLESIEIAQQIPDYGLESIEIAQQIPDYVSGEDSASSAYHNNDAWCVSARVPQWVVKCEKGLDCDFLRTNTVVLLHVLVFACSWGVFHVPVLRVENFHGKKNAIAIPERNGFRLYRKTHFTEQREYFRCSGCDYLRHKYGVDNMPVAKIVLKNGEVMGDARPAHNMLCQLRMPWEFEVRQVTRRTIKRHDQDHYASSDASEECC